MKYFVLLIFYAMGGFTGAMCFSEMRKAIMTGRSHHAGVAAVWLMSFATILYRFILL